MQPAVGLLEPRVELQLEVERVSERPARLEVRLEVLLELLDRALGLRIARLAEIPVAHQLTAEPGHRIASGARRPRAARPHDPRPASPGSAPNDHKQRAIPHSRSSASLENTSAPAPTRE